MKIYTCQPSDFLDTVDKNGYIHYSNYSEDDSIFGCDETKKALDWLNTQFDNRMTTPRDRNLIWVWPCWKSYFKEEVTIYPNYKIYVFEVPIQHYKNDVLWSDFILWHNVLNQAENTDYTEIFNINMKKNIQNIQGVTTRLKLSWLKKIETA